MKALFLVPVLMALQAIPSFARINGLECRGPNQRDSVSVMFQGARYMDMLSVQLEHNEALALLHPSDRNIDTIDENLFLNVPVGTCQRGKENGVLVDCKTKAQDVSFGHFSYAKYEEPVDGFSRKVDLTRIINADDLRLRVTTKGEKHQIELSVALADEHNHQTVSLTLNKTLGLSDELYHCSIGKDD